jgi:hypothetical protein
MHCCTVELVKVGALDLAVKPQVKVGLKCLIFTRFLHILIAQVPKIILEKFNLLIECRELERL